MADDSKQSRQQVGLCWRCYKIIWPDQAWRAKGNDFEHVACFEVATGAISPAPCESQVEQKSILLEADYLINGPRRQDYGHGLDDYGKTAALINALFATKIKEPFTVEDAILIMVLVKLSRLRHALKRDSLVDAAGYIGLIETVQVERERRAKAKG